MNVRATALDDAFLYGARGTIKLGRRSVGERLASPDLGRTGATLIPLYSRNRHNN
jgi:hypothetical protein